MTDLQDGQSIEVQGSASRPYMLKNVGGVLSCTCPAWRNQSLPIDHRTCKHLRALRGDDAGAARLGDFLAPAPKSAPRVVAPPLLLAESWDGVSDPAGYRMSEKLDGTRVWWDGKQLLSRNGNRFISPDWFTAGLPLEPLDGELWIGRKQFQRTLSIVRRQDAGDLWREVRFVIFDAPAHEGCFTERLELIRLIIDMNRPEFALAHPHVICQGAEHVRQELDRIVAIGGEGVMLRDPHAHYESGRSTSLLKVKRFHDAEAVVVGHEPGRGRHKGRLGALLVEMADGTRFAVGTGLSDAQRNAPPRVGSTITYRYQELSDGGVPRFPSFVGIRPDVSLPNPNINEGESMPIVSSKRRFEFVGGSSDKFWEVQIAGNEVVVRFGRNGTDGQTIVKTLPDNEAASRHADKLVREKLGKGYVEIN